MRFTLSDSATINSHGFRIDLEGMDLTRFRQNPVMLYAHNPERIVGRWENVAIADGRLTADAVFDTDDSEVVNIMGKVKRKFLRGCSVGIIVNEMREIDGIPTAVRSELLEASICAIPADRNAVALYNDNSERLSLDEIRLMFNLKSDTMETETKDTKQEQLQEVQAVETAQSDAAVEVSQSEQLMLLTTENETLTLQLERTNADLKEAHNRIAELEQQAEQYRKNDIKHYLSDAANAGKIDASEIGLYEKLADADYDTVRAIIDARQPKPHVTLSSLMTHGNNTDTKAVIWDELDQKGKLSELKATDFERFKEMYRAKFNADYKE